MNEQDKAQLYPIPVKIFYKNRFKSLQDIRRSDQQLLFYNKKTGQYITRNDINETRIVTPQDETMTDIRIGINFNNSDNIHEAIINKTPALILLQNRSYRYDGFGGHITVDFTDEDSSKVKNKESTWINMRKLLKNSKFPNFVFADENEFHPKTYIDQSNGQFFRSNTEIFNQLLKIRKDLNGIRRDIRTIKDSVQFINSNTSEYKKNVDIVKQFDRTILINNSKDANFRSDQTFNVITKPTYTSFLRTISFISPMLMSRLQANAAAPVLQEELRIRDDTTNSTKLPDWKHSGQETFQTKENTVRSSHRKLLISPIKSQNGGRQSLFITNKFSDIIKSNSSVNLTNECSESGKILQKSIINNHKIENEIFKNKEQEIPQFQQPTTSGNFQLFVTARSPNNEIELPNISLTKAYQPFSITRYTARSKIDFNKQINNLTNFNTLNLTMHELHNPASVAIASNHFFPHAIASSPDLLFSTENTLPFEFNNTNAVIPNFASPIASKSLNRITVAQVPFLLSQMPISNTNATVIVDTIPTSTDSTINTGTTIITTNPTTNLNSTTSTSTTTTVTSSISEPIGRSTVGDEEMKITRYNLNTVPSLIPLKPNFLGSNFDGLFLPWFNDPQFALCTEEKGKMMYSACRYSIFPLCGENYWNMVKS
uniref:Uncharacterized protein n=1 Tax=Onchocerca volvulus TaxID=6282 RepID=A0A8R1XQ89_ONCVO